MILRSLFALAVLVLGSAASHAGTPVNSKSYKEPLATPCVDSTLDWFQLETSYTGSSDFERGDDASGDAFYKGFRLNHRIPLDLFGGFPNIECGQWFLRLGLDYRRWDFDNEGGLPIPNTLQSLAAVIAVEYVVSDVVAVSLEARPGFYFEHDIRSDSFNVPVQIYAPVYRYTRGDFSAGLLLGASYNAFRSTQLIPAAGIVAKYKRWTLLAVPPRPRLIFEATDTLAIWAEGEATGGSFRTDAHDSEEIQGNLNHALVSYSEFRAGGGITWKPSANAVLEIGAGYAFKRKFDFHRAEEGFETEEGAPYAKLEFRAAF